MISWSQKNNLSHFQMWCMEQGTKLCSFGKSKGKILWTCVQSLQDVMLAGLCLCLPSSFSYIWTASSCPDLRQGKGYQIPGPVEIVPHISKVLLADEQICSMTDTRKRSAKKHSLLICFICNCGPIPGGLENDSL